jgi:hypothetical protein
LPKKNKKKGKKSREEINTLRRIRYDANGNTGQSENLKKYIIGFFKKCYFKKE